MKFLIVGLGNMDSDYFGTRHNIGFEVLDQIASSLGVSFKSATYAHIAETSYKGKKLLLIKPTTYMNLSGKALKYWLEKEKAELTNCFIILDDLNLEFGSIRIRPEGTDGGHNGLKDIQEKLLSSKYPRLRIGIGNKFSKGKQVDYVLGKWTEQELKLLPEIIKLSAEAALSFCFSGLGNTMNSFNSKRQ